MELMLFIAGLIGLIWGTLLLRHGGLLAGCLIVLLSGSCLGHSFFHIGPLTTDRVMLLVVLALYGIMRYHGTIAARPFSATDLLMTWFIGILSANMIFSDWRFEHGQPVSRLAFFYLLPFGLYWIARGLRTTERKQLLMFTGMALFGAYLGLTGVCEVKQITGLVFPRYIMSVEYVEFLGRARGPYLNPVANGLYLIVCLSAAIMLWSWISRPYRVVLAAASAMMLVGVYATLTRSVWIGAGLALVVAAYEMIPRRLRMSLFVSLGMVGIAAMPIVLPKLSSFKRDKEVSVTEMEESAKLRPILAAIAWNVFQDHPLFGCGFGQYKKVDGEYIAKRNFDLPMEKAFGYHQHNVFLSILVETGIVGLSAYLILVCGVMLEAFRLWRTPGVPAWMRQQGLVTVMLLLAYLVNGLFHDMSIIPMVNMLVFFMVGLTRNFASVINQKAERHGRISTVHSALPALVSP